MSHKYLHCHLAKLPRITLQTQELKDAVPGKPVTFTVKATGMEPLNYQWQQNVGGEREAWQSCDVERLPGANSSTLTIPSLQKSDEGSYRCVISNSAGSQISEPVHLRIGKIRIVQCNRLCTKCHVNIFLYMQPILAPRLTAHPQSYHCMIKQLTYIQHGS